MKSAVRLIACLAAGLGPAAVFAAQEPAPAPLTYTVDPGTKLPLALINSISTKHSAEGARVYLETVFPVLVNGRIVIPVGSWVTGTVTQVKKPGRVKGRGELYVRFDSLTLPNGVTRDFRGRLDAMDGNARSSVDRTEGAVKAEGNKAGDVRTVGETAATGTSVGVIAGGAAGHYGAGAAIGAAAGAAAGMAAVLLSRGPDAVLAKGQTVELVVDRPIAFSETELDFSGTSRGPRASANVPQQEPAGEGRGSSTIPIPRRR